MVFVRGAHQIRMGLFDKLATVLGLRKRECNVLVVGLDNSGKSTVLNHFKPEEQKQAEVVPTVGFNVERFKSRQGFALWWHIEFVILAPVFFAFPVLLPPAGLSISFVLNTSLRIYIYIFFTSRWSFPHLPADKVHCVSYLKHFPDIF